MGALSEQLLEYQDGYVLPEVEFIDDALEVKVVLFPSLECKENEISYYSLGVIVNRALSPPGDEDVHPQWSSEILSKDALLKYVSSGKGFREVVEIILELWEDLER